MSALAHMIEGLGVPTVALGLVRPHLEATRPPRALFVPFAFGRPLGEPEDAVFQTRVLCRALGLLERTDGPAILEEFTPNAPSHAGRAGWSPGFSLPEGDATGGGLAAEIAAVMPHWDKARVRFGRTTVGVVPLLPGDWSQVLLRYLADGPVVSPVEGMAAALALRFVADDLKAFYSEAAQAAGPVPGAQQVDRWFWSRTVAGRVLLAVRRAGMGSADNAIRTFAARVLVPMPYLPESEPQ